MKPQDKITKVERTDKDVDNSFYSIIYYEEEKDVEENVHYIAKKKEVPCEVYENELKLKKKTLEQEITELEDSLKVKERVEKRKEELSEVEIKITEVETAQIKSPINMITK